MIQAKELFEQGRLAELLEQHRHTGQTSAFDPAERAQEQAADYNAGEGFLHLDDGVQCDACRNKGWIAVVRGAEFALSPCACKVQRKAVAQMQKSGLKDLVARYTFDAFTVGTPWHRSMRDKANAFLASDSAWYFTGGQVGSGKTHICTAICAELLQRGVGVRYMLWRDESTRLKSIANDPGYEDAVAEWKTAQALYIDDLFKIMRSDPRAAPTDADVRLAFEILNYRYNDKRLRTIISSEWMIEELEKFDEGIASRILERSRSCCAEIGRSPGRNHRSAGGAAE